MKIIASIFKSFFKDDCLDMAEAIAFCSLLAIIPVCMMMVSIAGYFLGGSEEALGNIIEIAIDVLPVGREQFVSNLQSILDQRSSLSIFSIIFLIFIATLLVASIERSLDVIFKTVSRRNFFHSRLLGIALIFWVTLLFSLPTMVQILEGLLKRYGFNFPLSWFMTGKAYFMLIAFLAYIVTIVVIPNRKVYIRYAAVGGVFFAAGIGLARLFFQWYMIFAFHRYNIIYGSLTAVVLMIVWIYYLAVVLLFSAEFVAVLQSQMSFHRGKRNKQIGASDDSGKEGKLER